MRITVICENTVGKVIGAGEHGFSAFIETDQGHYLFDTGSGHGIVANSLEFNKDLRSIQKVFLSHGHNDHSGGLPDVLRLKGKVDVHVHPNVFSNRIVLPKENEKEKIRFSGMIYKREYLEFLGAHFIMNTTFTEVEKGIFLTGEVPRQTAFEKPDPKHFSVIEGKRVPDVISDDQSLILETAKGLVVIFGCAHSGMINTLNHIMNRTGKDHFKTILGGTHLDFLPPEQLEESIKTLKSLKIETIHVSHCTGMKAAFRLHQEFGSRFSSAHVGSTFEL